VDSYDNNLSLAVLLLKSVAGETLSTCDKAEPARLPLGRSGLIIYFKCRLETWNPVNASSSIVGSRSVPVIIKMAFYSAVNMHKGL
jgi:hypothetical protein